MWNAPQATADRPSSTSAWRQSTSRASSAPYWPARSGTVSISGSSYWPRSAVYVHGIAPFSRIQATATEVSRPPEKAMPTRSPTGRDWRTLDMPSSLSSGLRTHPSRGPPPSRPDDQQPHADDRDRDPHDVARDPEISPGDEV